MSEKECNDLRKAMIELIHTLPRCDVCKAPATWISHFGILHSEDTPDMYWCDLHVPEDLPDIRSFSIDDRDMRMLYQDAKCEIGNASQIRKAVELARKI